jgi:ABC-type Fe3+-hydroxamate transport system, periplasmic component
VSDGKKLVRYSEESLIAADPDAYIIQKGPMNPEPTPLAERDHYRDLRAQRAGRVLIVDEERFARPALAPWMRRKSWKTGCTANPINISEYCKESR